jgi:hypothetical protein
MLKKWKRRHRELLVAALAYVFDLKNCFAVRIELACELLGEQI